MNLIKMAKTAKRMTCAMALASSDQKNHAIEALIEAVKKHQAPILQANREDIAGAVAAGMETSLIDRLSLQNNRLDAVLSDLKSLIPLPDPVGECFDHQIFNGLDICKRRTPLGVLGVIYESRPNVTLDISALTIKSGNCAILRGGSETLQTNQALLLAIREALTAVKLPEQAIQLVESTDRALVKKMLRLYDYIDLIIPRGGAALHRFCRENSKIPVITGGIGICHLFVDRSADLEKSLSVVENAKVQRPTVCNALDTLLVHESIALKFIPKALEALSKKGVSFRLDDASGRLAEKLPAVKKFCQQAQPPDWDTEWLSLVLGIKVVRDLEEAVQHIVQHSTQHSDGILTEDEENAARFIKEIDSAAVYVNASTRFTDGNQLGLGAEVAISTQKLHARGPMGLRELTSYKWVIKGHYDVRK